MKGSEGHIYVMRDRCGRLKIGRSKHPEQRARELAGLEILFQSEHRTDAANIERLAHRVMTLNGRHHDREWFDGTPRAAIHAIKTAIKQADGAELALGRKRREWPLVMTRLPRSMVERLDAEARRRGHRPSRSAMIRELVSIGLDVEGRRRK